MSSPDLLIVLIKHDLPTPDGVKQRWLTVFPGATLVELKAAPTPLHTVIAALKLLPPEVSKIIITPGMYVPMRQPEHWMPAAGGVAFGQGHDVLSVIHFADGPRQIRRVLNTDWRSTVCQVLKLKRSELITASYTVDNKRTRPWMLPEDASLASFLFIRTPEWLRIWLEDLEEVVYDL